MPVLFSVLGAEQRRCAIVSAFHQFEQEVLFVLCALIEKPFVEYQQRYHRGEATGGIDDVGRPEELGIHH